MPKVLTFTGDQAREAVRDTIVLRIGSGLLARKETYIYVGAIGSEIYYRHEDVSEKEARDLIGRGPLENPDRTARTEANASVAPAGLARAAG
jgi:hypothetical protein